MQKTVTIAIGSLLHVLASPAFAYEVNTHQAMSIAAVKASTLSDSSDHLLINLGLYINNLGLDPNDPNNKPIQSKTITQWIGYGSIVEDDFPRSANHFYDPLNNRGLIDVINGISSPDWALEDTEQYLLQKNSLVDARGYLYQALTAKNQTDHDKYFGLTFQTLGQVIHHLQDMAQPQHVRNDAHCDAWFCTGSYYNPSLYEHYTDAYRNDSRIISYSGYDPVFPGQGSFLFGTARQFWSTGSGQGMAEFTNHNFVSAGTNYQLLNNQPAANQTYPDPRPRGFAAPVSVQDLFAELGETTTLTGVIGFVQNDVVDKLAGTTKTNERSASYSIYDQYLKTYGVPVYYIDRATNNTWMTNGLFTLNRFNFNAAYPLLIPKAVSYSAGLINYFFRGRLAAEDATFTETGVSFRVRNAIDAKKYPQLKNEYLDGAGNLVVTVDYKIPDSNTAGALKTVRWVSAPALLGETLYPGQVAKQTLAFNLPEIPDGANEVTHRLVYRGKQGQEEDAVAVGVFKPAAGFLVKPKYVPADGITGPRMIYHSHGKWKLSDRIDVLAGAIDWKGWFENGKPTEVLSWNAGSRYFTALFAYIAGGSPEIYKNGELFAIAPAGVLGAALNRAGGKEWLIAVTKIQGTDVVYRRPNKKSSSPALYDSMAEPEGWQEIGRYTYPTGMFFGVNPWLFNGDGTEAQTMRHIDSGKPEKLNRLKIVINGDSTSFNDLGNLDGIDVKRTTSGGAWQNELPYPCVREQSGTAQLDYVAEVKQSGEYIVAVDYRDTEEVLAKVVGSGIGTLTEDATYNWYTGNCSSSGWVRDATDTHRYSADFKRELVYGSTRIKLDNRNDEISTVTTWLGLFSTLDTGQAQANAGRFSLVQLAFVDIRHDLLAGIEFSDPNINATQTYNRQLCGSSTELAKLHHFVQYQSQDITVYEDPLDYGRQYCRSDTEDMGAFWKDDLTLSWAPTVETVYPGLGPMENIYSTPGAWVVDSAGRLVISQSISPYFGFFNYLTDGELGGLIPPDPGDVPYYPIGVVK